MFSRIIPATTSSSVARRMVASTRRYAVRASSSMASSGSSRERFFPKTDSNALLRNSSSASEAKKALSSDGTGHFKKVGFIGTGKMAQAIINPLIKTGLQPAETVAIFDVSTNTMKDVANQHKGIQMAQSITELIDGADLVVCGVKPQNINSAFFNEVRKANIPDDATFLSVIAGLPLDTYYATGFKKIVRSMPNTPAMIGKGMTVWCCTPNMTVNERDVIDQVLSTLGKTIYVDDERHVDMSTSISGSGPAYIFILMEAMIDAGVHMGFPRDKATTLVYHTLLGSTLFAMETGEHPAILRNNVTSPSGTTASALYELENGRFRTVIKDAMWACYRRSLEMGGHESNVGPGRAHAHEGHVIQQLFDKNDDLKLSIERKEDHDFPSK